MIHLPTRNIRPGEELFSYQRVITKWLEAGIRSAVTQGSRRTVICNDAIWPEELDWRNVEKTILAMKKHMYESALEEEPCEIVQVTLPGQDRERKAEMMDHLRKVTVNLRTRGREETGHKAGEVTQKCQALHLESEEDPEEDDDPCVKKAFYRRTEGTMGSPLTLTEQQSTPRATAPMKGAVANTSTKGQPTSTTRGGAAGTRGTPRTKHLNR